MCLIPTATTKPARSCRWLQPDAREQLMSGGNARLRISVTLKSGAVVTGEYIVFRCESGWTMLKEVGGKVAARYTVDTTFDENPGLWNCDCPDATRHPGRGCKHSLGLVAALKAIGILNV